MDFRTRLLRSLGRPPQTFGFERACLGAWSHHRGRKPDIGELFKQGLLRLLPAMALLIVSVVDAEAQSLALVCGTSACSDANLDVPLRNHLTTTLGHTVANFDDNDQSWTPTN